MSSQSLYRKWRSQSFDDIVGQGHVVRTLRNAIRYDRIAQAYLFTGPRGTGKTTMARVLAKAVNCLEPVEGMPDGMCRMCVSIAEGRCPDIIEIDGASNTGIENIRELRDRASFTPVEARFKVYIIDEVHRLSGNAFDGLLKILEEPPRHVLFVFASTEPHKVPGTILSRCQRFDFHRHSRKDTIARLEEIVLAEEIAISDDALALIAQQSSGSLRDAIGLLDQVASYAGETIEAEHVRDSAGLGRPTTISDLTTFLLDNECGKALRLIHDAVEHGVDPRTLLRQLIEYWRALLLQVNGAGAEVDIDPSLEGCLDSHGARLSSEAVVRVLHALTEQVIEPRLSVTPELPLELAVVEAVLVLHAPSHAGSSASREDQVGRGNGDMTATKPRTAVRGSEAQAERSPPTVSEPQTSRRQDAPSAARRQAVPAEPAAGPPEDSSTQRSEVSGVTEMSPAQARTESQNLAQHPGALPTAPDHSSGEQDEARGRDDDSPQGRLYLDAWPEIVKAARAKGPKVEALLRDARPIRWSDAELELGFPYTFHRDQIDQPENRAIVESCVAEVTGNSVRVRCVHASKEEIRALNGAAAADEDDGFVDEVERLLRGVHARKLKTSRSIT